jgi:hypothetical protein
MPDVMNAVRRRIQGAPPTTAWTPYDFLDVGARGAVDKALQRLVTVGSLRRIGHGLYDRPGVNSLTKQALAPDYRQVLTALARRDQARMLVDGLTAANDLGLTTAVPARVIVHTDIRRRSISLGNLTLEFRLTAPSKLYWAGRPAMRVVQALHWLKDLLDSEPESVLTRLAAIVAEPAIRKDLQSGLAALPSWMQDIVRRLLASEPAIAPGTLAKRVATKPASRDNRGANRRQRRPNRNGMHPARRA